MSKHKCHVPDCGIPTHPSKLMCPAHWKSVPENLKHLVLKHYQRDQCEHLIAPSKFWLAAARYSINAVTGMGVQWPRHCPI